ncbi:MAG: ABC transporter ATP-binding protein [Bdellovibrionales bacterium]|nr:ABC transporter ATP-binding protein [Bdellovibrionales bacterium]
MKAVDIHKSYSVGASKLEILKGLHLEIQQGEALCIVGSSGAGKSTLLHILGTLDRPTGGQLIFEGKDLTQQTDDDLAEFRSKTLGFVFQFHHLLSEFSAYENICMPARLAGWSPMQIRQRAEELIAYLGLTHRRNHYPSEMSGGEQQRVAIARALMNRPKILMADEPTGNLDMENSRKIQQLFFELQQKMNLTLIVVTHDREFSARFPRRLKMADGQ